jgi:hypothetical protein
MRHAAAPLGTPLKCGGAALALWGGMFFAKRIDIATPKKALRVRTGPAY